jgi:hypothetical protein
MISESWYKRSVDARHTDLEPRSNFGPSIDLTIVTYGSADFAIGGAVLEPSAWAMMLLGFAGLGYAGYRRAREEHAAKVAGQGHLQTIVPNSAQKPRVQGTGRGALPRAGRRGDKARCVFHNVRPDEVLASVTTHPDQRRRRRLRAGLTESHLSGPPVQSDLSSGQRSRAVAIDEGAAAAVRSCVDEHIAWHDLAGQDSA